MSNSIAELISFVKLFMIHYTRYYFCGEGFMKKGKFKVKERAVY
jgi:hypothetical protein